MLAVILIGALCFLLVWEAYLWVSLKDTAAENLRLKLDNSFLQAKLQRFDRERGAHGRFVREMHEDGPYSEWEHRLSASSR